MFQQVNEIASLNIFYASNICGVLSYLLCAILLRTKITQSAHLLVVA